MNKHPEGKISTFLNFKMMFKDLYYGKGTK